MGQNCLASVSIGCLFCYKGCSAEKVRNTFTFLPPSPSYAVEPKDDDDEPTKLIYRLEVLHRTAIFRLAAECADVYWVNTRKGSRIPIVWVHCEGNGASIGSRLVILHCHGNATDVGMMMGTYYELAKVLDVDVVGVEYSGYGAAMGPGRATPSESNTYADLEAAYDFMLAQGVSADRIIVYGQSVGSGPVSRLASLRQVGGLVLHSPLMSGIKVIDPEPKKGCRPSCVWRCFDFFPNYQRVKTVKCWALVMHGQRDEVVPFYHGESLHKFCPDASRWPAYFPALAGHNDLVEADPRQYYCEMAGFVKAVASSVKDSSVGPQRTANTSKVAGDNRFLYELAGAAETQALAARGSGARDFLGPMPVGPEDGRYEKLRLGDVRVKGGLAV